MENNTFCGMVAIVGRPNVGKSTLLNNLLGQKVSITSKKPQTTRHRIMGIHTEGQHQVVYVDTPGLHIEEKRAINRLMNKAAASSIRDVELAIFVVDSTRWTDDDEMVLTKLKQGKVRVVVAVNKIDLIENRDKLLPHLQWLGEKHDFEHIIPISAEKETGLEHVHKVVRAALPASEFYFPEDYITDRSQRFMVAEIVREKLMRFTGDELPYSVTVEIEQFKWQPKGIWHINALILVERETQKRMVIGNKGEKLKTIGREARKDIEYLLDNKVFLELWVKVKRGWADDERALHSLGYRGDQ